MHKFFEMSPTQNQKTFLFALILLAVSTVQGKRVIFFGIVLYLWICISLSQNFSVFYQGTWIPINLPLPAPAPIAATSPTTPATPTTPTPAACVTITGCATTAGCTVGETAAGAGDGTCDPGMQSTMCYSPACANPVSGTADCACAN